MTRWRWLWIAALLGACAHANDEVIDDDDDFLPATRGGTASAGKGGTSGGAGTGTAGASAGRGGNAASGAAGRAGSAAGEAAGGREPQGEAGAEASGGEPGTITDAELTVLHKTGNSDPNDNQIRMGLQIKSTAVAPVALSAVELRYYFTSEVALPLTIEIYDAARNGTAGYQTVSKDAVKAEVTSTNGYLALTFTDAAGILSSGDALTLDVAVHGPNWTGNFSETDDYSFAADHADFVASDRITLRSGSSVLWGTEPP